MKRIVRPKHGLFYLSSAMILAACAGNPTDNRIVQRPIDNAPQFLNVRGYHIEKNDEPIVLLTTEINLNGFTIDTNRKFRGDEWKLEANIRNREIGPNFSLTEAAICKFEDHLVCAVQIPATRIQPYYNVQNYLARWKLTYRDQAGDERIISYPAQGEVLKASTLLQRGYSPLERAPKIRVPANENLCVGDWEDRTKTSLNVRLNWRHGDGAPRKYQVVMEKRPGIFCTPEDLSNATGADWVEPRLGCSIAAVSGTQVVRNLPASSDDYRWRVREYRDVQTTPNFGPFSEEYLFRLRPRRLSLALKLYDGEEIVNEDNPIARSLPLGANVEPELVDVEWRARGSNNCTPHEYTLVLEQRRASRWNEVDTQTARCVPEEGMCKAQVPVIFARGASSRLYRVTVGQNYGEDRYEDNVEFRAFLE